MRFFRPRTPEQRSRRARGAVIPLVAGGLGLLMTATAFTVDLGRVMSRNREMQAIADVAALEAAKEIDGRTVAELRPDVEAAIAEALARHGETGVDLDYELGTYDYPARVFTPAPSETSVPNAVRVVPSSPVDYLFMPGTGTASRDAKAMQLDVVPPPPPPPSTTTTTVFPGPVPQPPVGAFTIGSYLAAADTNDAALLNRLLSRALDRVGAPEAAVTAVGWQGLATARINVADLAAQLGFGTPTELVEAGPIPVELVGEAMVRILQGNGDLTNVDPCATVVSPGRAQDLCSFVVNWADDREVRFRDILYLATQGSGDRRVENAAAEGYLHIPRVLTAMAFLADGDHAVTVPDLTFGIAGITDTDLDLSVIEAPVFVAGPVGTSGGTRQVDLAIANAVDLPVDPPTGATAVHFGGSLVVDVVGAGATGTLTGVDCADPGGIVVGVATQALSPSVTISGTLSVTIPLVGTVSDPITLVASPPAPNSAGSLSFRYLDEFDLPDAFFGPKRVGSHTLNLDSAALTFTDGPDPALLGALLDSVTTRLMNRLVPLVDAVDNRVVERLSRSLGLSLGGADVWANQRVCRAPILVP